MKKWTGVIAALVGAGFLVGARFSPPDQNWWMMIIGVIAVLIAVGTVSVGSKKKG